MTQIERLKGLEKQHEDRIAVLRRSFTQQLQDAIILIRSQYSNDLNYKLKEATADVKENELSLVNKLQRFMKKLIIKCISLFKTHLTNLKLF